MSEEFKSTVPKPFVFVLMPFKDEFSDIYKFGIKGSAEEVGAYAERVDEQIYTEGILERVYNQINKADVIVADMTGQNPNVFYEVGYAHALGKIVILLTKNADDIPFDLKHRPHIVYDGSIEKLKNELTKWIQWGINESKEEKFYTKTLEVTIAHTVLFESNFTISESPIIPISVEGNLVRLQTIIRNLSQFENLDIIRAYLFTLEDSPLTPHSWVKNDLGGGGWEECDKYKASQQDSLDELNEQYKLSLKLFTLQPKAVDDFYIEFWSKPEFDIGMTIPFRLRLHTNLLFYDFAFRLQS